jgi:Flp pilus assembly pilin Flp
MAILPSIERWFSDESGATAIEYSVIAATMGIMLVPVGASLGSLSGDLFQTLIDLFDIYQ